MGKLTFGATGMSYQANKVQLKTESPRCPRCGDRVYFNEEVRALGKAWHKRCFSCAKCKQKLDSTRVASHEEEVYCNPCHKKLFGPRGYGFAGGAAGLSTDAGKVSETARPALQTVIVPQLSPSSDANKNDMRNCPQCGKRVYHAEELKALGRNWHKLCFKCNTCAKLLQAGSCSEHGGMPYCKQCYQRALGIKGYGHGVGAGILLSEPDRTFYPARRRSTEPPQSQSQTFTECTPVPTAPSQEAPPAKSVYV